MNIELEYNCKLSNGLTLKVYAMDAFHAARTAEHHAGYYCAAVIRLRPVLNLQSFYARKRAAFHIIGSVKP
jgi:hypothetical protein